MNILLKSKLAEKIYEDFAKGKPIYDYHSHLSAKEIAEDLPFEDVGQMMLAHDHYKWRLMRFAGVDEHLVTGDAGWREKFRAYAGALETALGNPLLIWTRMELEEYFGIAEFLSLAEADRIYDQANQYLTENKLSPRKLIGQSRVKLIATTDDPADDLKWHLQIRADKSFDTAVLPTYRPDKALNVLSPDYFDYIKHLSEQSGVSIENPGELFEALKVSMDKFDAAGCKASDHSFTEMPLTSCNDQEAEEIFQRAMSSGDGRQSSLTIRDRALFTGYMMKFLAAEYLARDWNMLLHLFALRNQNDRMFAQTGPDAGYDSIGGQEEAARNLASFLNHISLNRRPSLPRTMVFTLEPAYYYALATCLGNFSADSPGRLQLGPAWWFNDNTYGIREQLEVFSATASLGYFNGMLTDSRSFLSFVRHDYFRRILASFIADDVEQGLFPEDFALLGELVERTVYKNAKKNFL